jgi:hypothetical protein
VLLEVGFLTNDDERERLLDGAYRDSLCRAVADGMEAWAGVERPEPVPDLPVVVPELEPESTIVNPPEVRRPWLERDAVTVAIEADLEPRSGEQTRFWVCRILGWVIDEVPLPLPAILAAKVLRRALNCGRPLATQDP